MESKEGFGGPKKSEIEPVPVGATDTEIALFFAEHIENPCTVELPSGEIANIRKFYIKEAEKLLLKMKNPHAKHFLERIIEQYEDK